MKHKITIVILPILVIISLALNIYQYQTLNTLKSQYTTLQSSIDDLTTEKQSLDSAVSDKDAEIATLTATIDDLQSQLEALQDDIAFMESIEPISVTMYALEDCDVYSEPDETSDKIKTLSQNEEVIVIGLVPTDHGDWYQLGNNEDEREVIGYVSATYPVDSKVTVNNSTQSSSGTSSSSSSSSSSGQSASSSSSGQSSASSSSSSSSGGSSSSSDLTSGFESGSFIATGDGSHIATGSGAGAGITVY